jgi:hypothetical protein
MYVEFSGLELSMRRHQVTWTSRSVLLISRSRSLHFLGTTSHLPASNSEEKLSTIAIWTTEIRCPEQRLLQIGALFSCRVEVEMLD